MPSLRCSCTTEGATPVMPGGAEGVVRATASGLGAWPASPPGRVAAAGCGAAAATCAGAGRDGPSSAGECARLRPSRSALRRTRSAWASSTLEEWLFTPIPIARHSSRPSLLVRPSSRASSYTRIFLAKLLVIPFLKPRCPSAGRPRSLLYSHVHPVKRAAPALGPGPRCTATRGTTPGARARWPGSPVSQRLRAQVTGTTTLLYREQACRRPARPQS